VIQAANHMLAFFFYYGMSRHQPIIGLDLFSRHLCSQSFNMLKIVLAEDCA
jgi:hypothetical protein